MFIYIIKLSLLNYIILYNKTLSINYLIYLTLIFNLKKLYFFWICQYILHGEYNTWGFLAFNYILN